jgi:succinyl-CoA synthetase beta subunit
MNIHEYQGKQILKKFGVKVPEGRLVEEGADIEGRAAKAAEDLQKERKNAVWVVKAQIHAGGRGKAGGVKVCKDIKAVQAAAKEIIGKTLVTPQTGAEGKVVHKVWIEEGSDIAKEFNLAPCVIARCEVFARLALQPDDYLHPLRGIPTKHERGSGENRMRP